MKRRRLRGKAVLGQVVSLGTAGLSSCLTGGGGGVDPPPPAPRCENLNAQRDLRASVTAGEGGALVVQVEFVGQGNSSLVDPRVSVVEGASVSRLEPRWDRVVIELLPVTPAPSRVFFVLDASFAGYPVNCAFQRGFTITLEGGLAIAESREALPFAGQPRAVIFVAGRDERRVTLRAIATPPGRHFAWSVTGGTFELGTGERMVWSLPDEPGLYQAELFVDHGDDGFALDTLVLEVHAARARGVASDHS